jgi:hypothetical protein
MLKESLVDHRGSVFSLLMKKAMNRFGVSPAGYFIQQQIEVGIVDGATLSMLKFTEFWGEKRKRKWSPLILL